MVIAIVIVCITVILISYGFVLEKGYEKGIKDEKERINCDLVARCTSCRECKAVRIDERDGKIILMCSQWGSTTNSLPTYCAFYRERVIQETSAVGKDIYGQNMCSNLPTFRH